MSLDQRSFLAAAAWPDGLSACSQPGEAVEVPGAASEAVKRGIFIYRRLRLLERGRKNV